MHTSASDFPRHVQAQQLQYVSGLGPSARPGRKACRSHQKSSQHITVEQWWALPWHHAWWSHLGTACRKHSDQHKNTTVQQLEKNKTTAQQLSWGETTQGPRQHQKWLLILAEDIEQEVSEPQNQRDVQESTKQVWEMLEWEGGCVLTRTPHVQPEHRDSQGERREEKPSVEEDNT